MIHIDNIDEFAIFLSNLGKCTQEDRGDHWFFFFPQRVVYLTLSKEGPLVQPYFSDPVLANQVKTGWPVWASVRRGDGQGEEVLQRAE